MNEQNPRPYHIENDELPLPHGVREAEERLAEDVYNGINIGPYEVQPDNPSLKEKIGRVADRGKDVFGRLIQKTLESGGSLSWNQKDSDLNQPQDRDHEQN